MTWRNAVTIAAALSPFFWVTRAAAAPDALRATRDESKVTHGMAEFGVGVLTLPGAKVCIEKETGCVNGESSLALSAWPLFRRGAFAAGAGVTLGVTSSTDSIPGDIPREHWRRYLSAEVTARYYVPVSERVDGWVGVTTGLGVVNDTFQSESGLGDKALVGPRGSTILTEGLTIGLGLGVTYALSDRWRFGGNVRVSNWFLPSEPAHDPFGDQASLTGRVTAVDLGVTLAYRSALVF
jgi:hypothetical protein